MSIVTVIKVTWSVKCQIFIVYTYTKLKNLFGLLEIYQIILWHS